MLGYSTDPCASPPHAFTIKCHHTCSISGPRPSFAPKATRPGGPYRKHWAKSEGPPEGP